jgi:hypothetical protein
LEKKKERDSEHEDRLTETYTCVLSIFVLHFEHMMEAKLEEKLRNVVEHLKR